MLEARIIVIPGIGAILIEKEHKVILGGHGNVLYSYLCCGQMQNLNICML